jgi:cobalt-zinc-cadmium resistance protein CzcA
MGGEFIPELEEGDFAIDTRLLTGSSLTNTVETCQKAAGMLKEVSPKWRRWWPRSVAARSPPIPCPSKPRT